jgi:hypothetical protein
MFRFQEYGGLRVTSVAKYLVAMRLCTVLVAPGCATSQLYYPRYPLLFRPLFDLQEYTAHGNREKLWIDRLHCFGVCQGFCTTQLSMHPLSVTKS